MNETRSFFAGRSRPIHWAVAAVAALVLCANVADSRDTLGPGDTVRVSVYQNSDLDTETRLSAEGTIVMPLVGEIAIDGLTPANAGERIAARFEQGRYLVDPQVTVSLITVRSRQVSVLGHVSRPGQYPLDGPNVTLTDVLAMAGGIVPNGNDAVVVMARRDGETVRHEVDIPRMYANGDMTNNLELRGGDRVFVPAADIFYVYGEVRQAGSYRLRPKITVLDALSLAGGLTPRGTDSGVRIHRKRPDGSVELLQAELTDPVRANDVIHVRESLF